MQSKRLIFLWLFFWCVNVNASVALGDRDLAMIFPLDTDHLITVDDANSAALFPEAWYTEILSSYSKTFIGEAIYNENLFSDWTLVGIRVAPCSTFQTKVSLENDQLCWPGLRLIWQPILHNFRIGTQRFDHYADDRAVHALYDIPAALYLPEGDAAVATMLLEKAKSNTLTTSEYEQFVAYSRLISSHFLSAVKNLRSEDIPDSDYEGFSFRPETIDTSYSEDFFNRLRQFLLIHTPANNIKALTAFSLPEGRQPALLDEWLFLAFGGKNGTLTLSDTLIHNPIDGEPLVNMGTQQRASTSRDDPRLYEDGVFELIKDTVILFTTDFDRLSPIISDRSQRLVPNSSCASCHKMNESRFNFHNFSYLQDRVEMTVSPRVIKDVALDKAWINTYINNGKSDEESENSENESGESILESITLTNDIALTITDNDSDGVVSSINANISKGYKNASIAVSIRHTYQGDLVVQLTKPSGSKMVLHNQAGGAEDDLSLTLDIPLSEGDFDGVWALSVSDNALYDTGYIESWRITFN